jgi:exosortase A
MSKVQAEPQTARGIELSERRGQLRAFGLVMLCVLAVISVFNQTFVEMVRIWGQSQTYSHGYLVLPIFVYLVWQRSAELAVTPIRPFVPAAFVALAAGFSWLVGELASALTLSFFAMIALVPLTVTTVLGLRWAKILAFPFAILFFAVPFGEIFVPTLMQWTADFTVMALKVSGVPVYRDGQNLVIPSGNWSIVEACSGVRYLLATLFVGALYAWQMYRSPRRRAIFIFASIVVPIVANWLRAYLIVMLGHLSSNRIAAGVDHLIYGWIFFGIVIMIMFAVGAIWREDDASAKASRTPMPKPAAAMVESSSPARVAQAAGLMLAVLLASPAAAAVLMRPLPERALPSASIASVAGWIPVNVSLTDWQPQLQAPIREQRFVFEKDGQRVGVFVGLFRDQRQGAELVSSVNQLVGPDNRKWQRVATGARNAAMGGRALSVQMETLRATGGTIVAWRWYCLDGISTASDFRAKFLLAIDRLTRRDDTSAWVAIFVVNPESPAAGELTLAAFAREMGEALERGVLEVVGQ